MKKWISHFAEKKIHHSPSFNESPTLRNDNPPPLPPFHPISDPNLRLNQLKAKIPPDDAQQRYHWINFLNKMWSFCEITLNDILWNRQFQFYGNIWNQKDFQIGQKVKNCAVSNVKSDFLTENNVWPFILSLAPHPPLPGATSQVWNERKSAKSEIFRQTDFLTKWGEILHNMVRGGNDQILWLPGQGCINWLRV